MQTPQLRPALNQLTQWWHGTAWRAVAKAWARLLGVLPALLIPAGWAFLTWSMFLWNARAWAASAGLFFLLNGVMPAIEAYIAAKARARRSPDQ